MEYKYEDFFNKLNVKIKNGLIELEGVRHRNEYTYLIFEVGNQCQAFFNRKRLTGTIKKITEKNVTVQFDNINKTKVIDAHEFIRLNIYTETVIRIEKNGNGPYTSREKSEELKDLMDMYRNKDQSNHPSPYYCWNVYTVPEDFLFGFNGYDQLFNWFTLSDIQIMINSGFKIVTLQKGRDYVESIYHHSQVAFSKQTNVYNRMLTFQQRSFLE